ncbi:hypothetical protein [Aeromonas bivalvium]|uniref:hypothetical protein n=1 Tax=Aeromonas bivalvium TaxID=440079 RepID=UPI0038D071C4
MDKGAAVSCGPCASCAAEGQAGSVEVFDGELSNSSYVFDLYGYGFLFLSIFYFNPHTKPRNQKLKLVTSSVDRAQPAQLTGQMFALNVESIRQ